MKIKWLKNGTAHVVLSLVVAWVVALPRLAAGDLVHCWTFNDGKANDSVGTAHGVLEGNAVITDGQLHIPGSGRFITSAIGQAISVKTLLVWTTLPDPSVSTMGSALTLESDDSAGNTFDGIVYGESIAGHWMAGSDGWNRTEYPQSYGFAETATNEVMLAIVYNPDNSVTVYRNGELYGSYYKGSLVTYGANALVQIGPRHASHADVYNGFVNEARVYNSALSPAQVADLYAAGPNTTVVSPANNDFEEGTPGLPAPRWTFLPGQAPLVSSIIVDDANPYYPAPPQGAKMANLEAHFGYWSDTSYPMLESEVLGLMATGEAYTFCATAVSTAEDISIRAAAYRFSLWDATAGEEVGYVSGDITTQNTTNFVTFTTPATDAGRVGHVLKVRLAADGHGYSPDSSVLRLAVDNVTVTTVTPASAADGIWMNPAGGSWMTAGNWSGNTLAGGVDAVANFSTLDLTADTTVTLDGPRSVGHLIFGDTDASHDWRLTADLGGPLMLAASSGSAMVTVNNRNATLALELMGADGLVKNGAGTLTLADAHHYTGPISVNEGTLKGDGSLLHRWSFNDGTANDAVGTANGTLYGDSAPAITGGKLVLNPGGDQNQYMATSAFAGETVGACTLVAWVALSNLGQPGGAGPLGLHPAGVDNFDAIVYGERVPGQWMNGSSMWGRTHPDNGGAVETSTDEVMMVIVYDTDNSIRIYRNGVRYDVNASWGALITRTEPIAVLGRRFVGAGPSLQGSINEARVYSAVLSPDQIAELYAAGPDVVPQVFPSGAAFSVAAGATLDLNGCNQTVATLSGAGTVTKGAITVSGSLEPGDAGAPGTLTVGPGLSLPADTALRYDFTDAAADSVHVNGTLTLQGTNTVTLAALGAALPPRRITLFTFDALAGVDPLDSLKVQGLGLSSYKVDLVTEPTSIYLRIRRVGTMISLF